jgi:lipopolysaccharide transport system ATP-binding protein
MQAGAMEVRGIGKQYKLFRRSERYRTMRDAIANAASRIFRRGAPAATGESIWALSDVSFRVKPGEVIGLIGRNGAGKSTLLKILARITEPTVGSATIYGRVGSLLEVGTGFHQELTGRENTYLNGAVLGMRRKEIDRKFDEIVRFAELEKFMDTPVKHYSTGMYMRLAFAVAAHLETEILLVDEVLAVGDAQFQKKCMGKMGDLAAAGRTVLFVSHNLSAVTGLCQRALWIDRGKLLADGPVDEIAGQYVATLSSGSFKFENERHGLKITKVLLRTGDGVATSHFEPGDDLVVEVAYEAIKPVPRPYFLIYVSGLSGLCFGANMLLDGRRPPMLEGSGVVRVRFRNLPLLPQPYTVWLGVKTHDSREHIVLTQEVASFAIAASGTEWGYRGEYFHQLVGREPSVVVPYEWTLPGGDVERVGLPERSGVETASGAEKAAPGVNEIVTR